MTRNLSTGEAARILGLREPRIRELVRSGLLTPSRRGHRYVFSFQDLVVLRAAKGLIDARLPATRVRRALAALLRELPADRPLSGVRIYADGRQIAVCDRGSSWEPETGQMLLDFEVDSLARLVQDARDARASRAGNEAGKVRASLEFERALDLEDEAPEAAIVAYRRALELDPDLVDAYVNLAIALEDTDGPRAAAAAYQRALALDPEFADAHYNLAGLCEQLDLPAEALRHYRTYKELSGV